MTTSAPPSRSRAHLDGGPLPAFAPASLWEALLAGDVHAPWLVFHAGATRVEWSRADLAELALDWAGRIGGAHGGRVGVLLPNGADFVAVFFAAQALGMTAVPLPWPVVDGDPPRVREALTPVLERARLDVLCTTEAYATTQWPCRTVTVTSPGLSEPVEVQSPLGRRRWGGCRRTERSAPAFIQFTSGSTGHPRGAVISQRAALASATAMASALQLGPADVGVSWLPFFHDMGLVGVLLTSLVAGFRVHVLRPGDFLMRPRKWLELVSTERATLTVGPNFAWELVVRRVSADGLDLSSLRCALNGSEPVHRTTLDGFATKFASAGFKADALLPVYGLAEATLGVAFSRPGAPRPDLVHDGRAVPAAGAVIPGIEVQVCDAEGNPRGEGEEGELCVRGPSVMDGYFEDPEATAMALRGPWLRTGDLGMVRDATVYVTGREKELVIQGGRKFHPYDLERVVSGMVDTTPNGVACVSRPDAATGSEALVVVVELRRVSGAIDPLRIKGELLGKLGVRADEIVFVPAGVLPRTTSGKVKRREVAATWEQLQRTPSPPAEERVGVRRRAPAAEDVPEAEAVSPHPDPLPREGERETRKFFVLGAGGFLGLNTVRAFLDAGITPTCGRRARGNVLGLRGLGCPLAVTDFTDADALAASLAGTDVLVHAAGHYPRFSLDLAQTVQRGVGELDTVLHAAAKAKVRRLVFVSSTATIAPRDDRASTEADTFDAAPGWGTYHALKWHLEQRLAREDRFEVVIAHPAACLGPFDWKVGTSALLVATANGTPPPHPQGRITTVDARDVGAALVKLATLASPPRRLVLAHESFDAHELLVRLADRYGAPRPHPPLAPDVARALADAQEHEAARTGGRAQLARELVDLIVHSPRLDASLSRTLGIAYRSLSNTLDAWDAWAQRMGLIPRPRPELTA